MKATRGQKAAFSLWMVFSLFIMGGLAEQGYYLFSVGIGGFLILFGIAILQRKPAQSPVKAKKAQPEAVESEEGFDVFAIVEQPLGHYDTQPSREQQKNLAEVLEAGDAIVLAVTVFNKDDDELVDSFDPYGDAFRLLDIAQDHFNRNR